MCRRSIASVVLVAGALALEWLCRAYGSDPAHVVRADFGVSAGVVIVVSLLTSLFARFGGVKTDLGTKLALEGVRGDVSNISKTLTGLIVGVAGQLASALGVVRRFLSKVFTKLYDMLANLVQRVARILDKIFGPIIDFLDKVKKHLKKFYDKVLKPIIDTIEAVRAVLRLLSFFNIEWAKKLDAKLQQLEEYVLFPYEWLTQRLNEAFNIINRIVTLDGLLQRVTLLQSLLRDVVYTNNLWWNSQLRPQNKLPPGGGGFEDVDPGKVIDEMRFHFRSGNADVSPAIRESVANVRINLRRAA
jgi:hypothetical protein